MKPLRAVLFVALAGSALVVSSSLAALASGPGAPTPGPVSAPASEGPYITAVGVATFTPSSTDFVITPQTLNVVAQSQSDAAGVNGALDEMEARLLAIKSAIEKLGVPSSGIRFTALNLQPMFGVLKPGDPSPVEKGKPLPQQVTSYSINGSLQADIPSVKLLIPAINAATANGATMVNTFGGKVGANPPPQPVQADLERGVAQAIANARATAEAMAAASGKKLGGVHSISSQQVFPTCCPPNNGWTIQITVSFDIAP